MGSAPPINKDASDAIGQPRAWSGIQRQVNLERKQPARSGIITTNGSDAATRPWPVSMSWCHQRTHLRQALTNQRT